MAAAGEVLAARRVEELGAYRAAGHRSTAQLLAARGVTTLARATEVVETAKRLEASPGTEAALRAGAVSVEQAHAITMAVEAVPSAEGDLLALAGREGLRTLQDRARHVRLEADDDRLGRYRRQHAARSLVHGRDDEGMVWGRFRLPPDLGAVVVNRIEHQADAEHRAGHREGRREGHDRYLADALVTLVTARAGGPAVGHPAGPVGETDGRHVRRCDRPDLLGGDGLVAGTVAGTRAPGATAAGEAGRKAPTVLRPAPRVDMVVHVSHEALRRGAVEGGELCLVQGVGPIPLERAREIMDDAFLKAVLVEGAEVTKVRHLGRRVPAELRTALEVRSILRDGDLVCSVPGCDRRAGIEWDHRDPHARGGPTSYENIHPLCRPHHREKTGRDWSRSGPDPPSP
ncbi:MAG: HNH endonuclease [Acidimicrobiia bacterium]|nr:HNH endonuclease [Acidimicrobiia bacterium]